MPQEIISKPYGWGISPVGAILALGEDEARASAEQEANAGFAWVTFVL